MIPKRMHSYLRERLPDNTWDTRLRQVGDHCFLEFDATDVDRLARLGIEVDALGPRLVVCMWDAASPLEIGGYLVVDNLAMGRPALGGIRMLPDVTPAVIHNLARGMTLKNAAAKLPFGGGKAGIVAEVGLSAAQHTEVIRGFAQLLWQYRELYLPGPDVGTNDADMQTIAIENGLDSVVSKPADMGGNRIDQLGAAAGGVIIALQALLAEMPRLKVLPQFANLQLPTPDKITVIIQGFGAVGAHAARMLQERVPDARVIGISDAGGYLYNPEGLPVPALFQRWQTSGLVTRPYFLEQLAQPDTATKYASQPDDLLREPAFCLIPAAPMAQYLDTDAAAGPSVTVDRMGRWTLIVEGANTYSPDPTRQAARARMERAVYRQHGVLIATDYLVNSGGVIFAAQEQLLKTPAALCLPDALRGERAAVERWLITHAEPFAVLAEQRRQAAEAAREAVIRRNMRELVDLLIADADMLPCEAAERISVRRIAARERGRTAADLMEPLPTILLHASIREAALTLVEAGQAMLAVVAPQGELTGVLTRWDITRAVAQGLSDDQPLTCIMTPDVIAASPDDTILELVHKLEHHDISAMPVVDQGVVLGMVSTDLLAQRSLLRLLQSQSDF
ncbi:MAG: CBS domain-containing protein [Candidatus Tectomicrobia bacterium]|uniref:CBS domain-containing protein n=1 Tax=Tectimicrobiota bacterium TaxID=2528274 RepID=A0A938B4E5_UNCTE|nr:CBS domain-containing protein [Candidatus Tectomicrobia bacterium]